MRYKKPVVAKPILFPACCVSCGAVENTGRSFFVDLGFDINHLYDAMPDGAVYLCNVCMLEYVKIFMDILEEQERTLEDVTFGRQRTDPVFDSNREFINSIEFGTEQSSDSSESTTVLSASFGG